MNVNPIGEELYTKKIETEQYSEKETTAAEQKTEISQGIILDSKDEEAVLDVNADANSLKAGGSKEKNEKKIEKINKKLEKLEDKLANTESEKKQAKIEKKIEKLENKLEYYEGLAGVMTSDDESLNKLYAKKFKIEQKLDDTDSDKKQAKLQSKIDKLDEKIKAKGGDVDAQEADETDGDEDADELQNTDELTDNNDDDAEKAGAVKTKYTSNKLSTSSDSKLQALYDELYDIQNKYDRATSDDEIEELEAQLDELEEKIEKREEELEELKTDTNDDNEDDNIFM